MQGKNSSVKPKHPAGFYSLREEIANSITHGVGAGLSIAGLTVLIILAVLRNSPWHLLGFTVYGITLVLLYLGSTLYHSIQHRSAKVIFQRLDHAAIYLLIAGTYTPFMLVKLRDAWGLTLLVIIWGLAVLGVAYKMLFINHYERLSTLGYVLMGWLCVAAGKEFLAAIPADILILLAVGGVLYTLGITFLIWQRIPYNHAIWHVFVLVASACHYFAVLKLIPA
jgi:hemolysin III